MALGAANEIYDKAPTFVTHLRAFAHSIATRTCGNINCWSTLRLRSLDVPVSGNANGDFASFLLMMPRERMDDSVRGE